MPPDLFDAAFDELLAKGFLEQTGVDADGEPQYRLTGKAADYFERANLHAKLKAKQPLTAQEQQRVNQIVAGLTKQN
jgi:hypothetical protein